MTVSCELAYMMSIESEFVNIVYVCEMCTHACIMSIIFMSIQLLSVLLDKVTHWKKKKKSSAQNVKVLLGK